jgi:hypothetical protein
MYMQRYRISVASQSLSHYKSICTLRNMEPCSLCTTEHGEAPIRSMHGQHWKPHMLLRYRRLKLEAGYRNNLVRSLLSKYNIPNSLDKSREDPMHRSCQERLYPEV